MMKKAIVFLDKHKARFFFYTLAANSLFFLLFWLMHLNGPALYYKLLVLGLLVFVFMSVLWGFVYAAKPFDKTIAKVFAFVSIPLILILPYPAMFGTPFYLFMPLLFLLSTPFLFSGKDTAALGLTFFIIYSFGILMLALISPAGKVWLNYASQLILFAIVFGAGWAVEQLIRFLQKEKNDLNVKNSQLQSRAKNLERQLRVSRQHTELLSKDVRKRDVEIQNILMLSGQIKARTDSRQVLHSFLLTAIGQIGSSHALLLTRSKKENHFLQVFLQRGLRDMDVSKIRIYLNSNLFDILNAIREPLLVSQIPREGLYEDEAKLLKMFSKDLICPIFINGALKALFFIGPKVQQTDFSKEDVNLVAIIANQTSFILEQTQMANDYREFYSKTMRAMLNSLETKYIYARGHNIRTANYVNLLSKKLGLSGREINDFSYGALMHDIGKVVVPDKYLLNSEKFTNGNIVLKEKILQHTIEGARILKSAGFNEVIVDMALHHHEFHNGQGFPDRMGEKDISLGTKILSVCNAYDAMTSDRPYRKALNPQVAKQNMLSLAGVQFDPELVGAFVDELNHPLKV